MSKNIYFLALILVASGLVSPPRMVKKLVLAAALS
jgi:hypothetical protein